ncbi:MAG: UDP-N-acetylmuramoyl-L-alanine--D-glutamate ligase [Chloroflexi bacterium]|nr:UDP-N-acetylmuramoyl-L-alanine--D-glutamate ligase [Chloroflexota bacterium]
MTTMTAPAPDRRAPRLSGAAPGEPLRFAGLRVGVVGLGVEGIDIVRFLHREGAAEIVVSERKPIDALRESIRALGGIPVAIEAGGNDPGLAARVDALFVSQGVPGDLPLLTAARAAGVPITAMMRLFLQRCPAPVIGITGSAGKTTVTSLVGAMFEAAGRPAFVGGNIGRGLLSALDEIELETTAVLEISHTQLVRTDRSPRLAAVLNVTPNHLDQFAWDDYVDLKRNLVRWQRPGDLAVLPANEPVAAGFAADTPATVHHFGMGPGMGPFDGPGATIADGRIVWRDGDAEHDVCPAADVRLPGAHNRDNVLAAVAIGGAWGLPPAAMADAIRGFTGVPHRLETVAEVGGVRYVDDSIATTPERTVAALRALEGPIVLLLGGREKRLPLAPLAEAAHGRLRAAVGFGEAGAAFTAALRAAGAAPSVVAYDDLADAVAAARAIARPGDTVLLSPAGTSFDAYPNFAARGDHFRALARGEEGADGAG